MPLSVNRVAVSRLVVPGHARHLHVKALDAGADEVVFDLEDAVASTGKAHAREQVADTLTRPEWHGRPVAVRVNAPGTPEHEADLAMCAGLTGPSFEIVVPKVESLDDIRGGARIAPVQALIETPQGLAAARRIAGHEAVSTLILGYADLAAALGRRGAERDVARWLHAQETLLACARTGGAAAIDGPSFALRDPRAVAASARTACELGFDGKWAIHPGQIEVINAVFAASDEELRWARRVKRTVSNAHATGGAAAALDAEMVDAAMVRRADRLLSLPPVPAAPEEPTKRVAAPYFDDLAVGDVFSAPGVTVTPGHAAMHQAIIGDRLRLALDSDLYEAVTGTAGILAHPMLVCDIVIGQSTAPSMRVLGNLFYRGLALRPVPIGTTLRTTTTVVARRSTSGRRGIAALHARSVDPAGVVVGELVRAPLLPALSDRAADDDLDAVQPPAIDLSALVPAGWDLGPLRDTPLGPLFRELAPGDTVVIEAGETVTGAPELARLSLNMAHAHTDAEAGPHAQRLVYGGHVIGIAAAHVVRAFPDLATILTWENCAHLGPTFEGDRLRSRIELTDCQAIGDGGLVRLRVRTTATGPEGLQLDVLDWSLVALHP